MESYFMGYMDEVCLAGSYPLGERYGVINQLMGMMRALETQSVDNKRLNTLQIRNGLVVNGLHICDIRQFAYTIAKNRQLTMHHFYWQDVYAFDGEGLIGIDIMHLQQWHTRIQMFFEAIR